MAVIDRVEPLLNGYREAVEEVMHMKANGGPMILIGRPYKKFVSKLGNFRKYNTKRRATGLRSVVGGRALPMNRQRVYLI